ncbi:OmpA family protein [Chitinophaga agrisoli]|uniref:OmpA family protein n=1 Tax=Chitinophaga agrisoli TaxID=2607653 RepID=A0A5B2VWT6_9BACT|nr:OmpA family protein [Chitinophaga agrisoli]KAA2242772.1 OmpA family protein [Chitinophaga agrisoli]
MIRCSLTIALVFISMAALYSQEQKSVLRLAEEAYSRQEYAVAGALYNRLARSRGDKMPVDQWMRLARCYQETGNFKEAAGYYQHIISRPDHPVAAYFAYGEALRQLQQYDSARQQYNLFSTVNADSIQLKAVALQSCDSSGAWRQSSGRVQLQPVKELNTPGSDLVSGVVQKGLLLMSTGYRTLSLNSGSEAHPATDKRTEQPYYKAYVYRQYSLGNANMYLEELLPGLLGKYDYHIGPVCLNNTEDTLYATINIQGQPVTTNSKGPANGVRQLQIYQSVKKNGKWAPLVLLPGINVAGYSSSHAVLNSNGSVLYFVSDRPGGLGQTDIWYAEKQADGTWGVPVNCGAKINTVAAEIFPTVNEEGILYFSSKGYAGLGGYDIYRAKGDKASWETPENMKAPFNSGADDMGLILKRNGYEGYLASNKQGGMGSDDIYYFTDPGYSDRFNPAPANSGAPVTTGPETGGEKPPAIVKTHTAEEEDDKRQLEQLKFLYNYNSTALLTESRKVLDAVAGAMKRHPDWRIVIVSYADSRGPDQYNTDLSALRCYAAIDYLVNNKGIDPRRLYYSNKGEQEPVNGCKDGVPCTEEDYKQNRRTQVTVIW